MKKNSSRMARKICCYGISQEVGRAWNDFLLVSKPNITSCPNWFIWKRINNLSHGLGLFGNCQFLNKSLPCSMGIVGRIDSMLRDRFWTRPRLRNRSRSSFASPVTFTVRRSRRDRKCYGEKSCDSYHEWIEIETLI